MEKQFYLNGEWLNSKEIKFNGFKDGTTIYEVIRVIDGIPLFLEEHLHRLTITANLIDFKLWISIEIITQTIGKLINKNNTKIGNVQILLNQRQDSADQNFICRFIQTHYPNPEFYTRGVKSMLFTAVRDNPKAKKVNQSLREATDLAIKGNKVHEVILADENNLISEGSKSNVFFVKDEVVYTSHNDKVLAGVTRQRIFKICEKNGIKTETKNIYSDELNSFDAAFFTGTSPKILPINYIGQTRFDPSNKLVQKLIKLYDQDIKDYISSATEKIKR